MVRHRVQATRPSVLASGCLAPASLMHREMRGLIPRQEARKQQFQQFSQTHTLASFAAVPASVVETPKLPYVQRRSRVQEIVSTPSGQVFTLTKSGLCKVYDLTGPSPRPLCFLNVRADEVVRSVFYNKLNNSVVTVSVHKRDDYRQLSCRSTPLPYVLRSQPNNGYQLFDGEFLGWPGFVEFDDVNCKVVTYSDQTKTYRVWDLKNYEMLYQFSDQTIQEIKLSPGLILVIHKRLASHLVISLLDVKTGELLGKRHILIQRWRRIDFVEQFNNRLLIKQEGQPLQVLDLISNQVLHNANFDTPAAFIFLYESQRFLTFKDCRVSLWDRDGQGMSHFPELELWSGESSANTIFVSDQHDLILAHCRSSDADGTTTALSSDTPGDSDSVMHDQGVIVVAEVSTGRRLATYHVPDLALMSSLSYNETRNELYVGFRTGEVQVWTN